MSLSLVLLIITGLLSYQAFNNRGLFEKLKHYPYLEARNKEYYRFITSGFIHGSWTHLLINMFMLYEFGTIVEAHFLEWFGPVMGRINYLLLYVLTIVVADLPSYLKHRNNPGYAAIGASGAISGILFIYILINPWSILLLFFIIPAPAIILGIGYLIYSSWAAKNSNDNIGHDAHFFGALFGMLFAIGLKPALLSSFFDELINGFPL